MRAWIARHVDAVGCGLLSLLVGFVWYSVWARIPWPWPAVAAVVAVGALAWLLEEARRHLLGELRIHHQQILDGAVDVLRFRSGEGGAIGVPGQPSTPRTMGPSLDQGAYAEILEGDRVRIARDFEFDPRSSDDVEGFTCRRCHRRARKAVVTHPIWDGPFEGSGSGVVDERVVPFCVRCDVSAPLEGLACSWHAVEAFADGVRLPGLPVRIPWLDQLPVRLHSELFDRVTFHRLPIKVERWRPPVPDEAGHQVLEGAVIDPHFFESGKPIVALDEIPDPLCARCGLTIHDPIHGAAAGEAWRRGQPQP